MHQSYAYLYAHEAHEAGRDEYNDQIDYRMVYGDKDEGGGVVLQHIYGLYELYLMESS